MATKRLLRVTLHGEAPTPLNPPIGMRFIFEWEIDGVPEMETATVSVIVPVNGTTTYAQSYATARTEAEALLVAQGLGGHTVVNG